LTITFRIRDSFDRKLRFYGYDRARRPKSSLRELVSAAASIAEDGIRDRFMVLLPVTCDIARSVSIELATPRFSVKEMEVMVWPWLQGLS
jgi:hypothetical protein